MILIDLDFTQTLLKNLKKSGWKQVSGYSLGNPKVLERNRERIAVVRPIRIDPSKVLQDEIDKFFKSLEKILEKNAIEEVFLPGGGTIPIPQFFLDYCKKHNIQIHLVTVENFNQMNNFNSL
jgi:hypothetical protein